jgi:hypothetical protein
MRLVTNVDYYVIGDISGDDCEVKENGEWERLRIVNGVKFGYCTLYDGAAPSSAFEEAENVWALCNMETDIPDDVTFYNRRLPSLAINKLANGELEGIVVGREWVIIPAEEFPFED